jgi:outer membrane protein assembly factor BamD
MLLALAAVAMSACNKYEKLLKSPDFAMKYREANKFHAAGKTEKALRLYENVLPFYRSRPQEDSINMQIARCYYALYDYITAAYYFDYVRSHFPRSPFVEEADHLTAMSSYNQVLRAELDQAQTYDAIQKFEYFINKHPQSQQKEEVQKQLSKLEAQLARKSYLSAKLYYHMEQYKAAIVALKNSIKQFPESPYREEMLFLALKACYLHAVGSVADKQQERYQTTIDEYLTLMSEFPNSRFKPQADDYYQEVTRKIETTNR